MTAFIIVAAVGLVILLTSLLVDGIGDVLNFEGAGGVISGASIGGLISGIGFGGVLGLTLASAAWVVALASIVTGLSVAAVAVLLYALLRRAQGNEADLDLTGVIGGTATVRGVLAEDATGGTVALVYLGAPRVMRFVADQALASGDQVRVTALLDPDTVRVELAEQSS
ncbi:MAG: hypothetical protein LBJ62_02235 [Bifidobacteriaceae bacterium]|nr:hypothetical protein [Bifidobacteriaceae bacterium]